MCTNFLLDVPAVPGNGNRQYISARSLELNKPYATSLYRVPAGEKFPLFPNRSQPWTGTYGFVGLAFKPAPDMPALIFLDGMNQTGFSCAALWMPGSEYPPYPPDGRNALEYYDFCAWAMSRFGTVTALLEGLNSIKVFGSGQSHSPMHYIATDATGASVVVEFMNGVMQVYPPGYSQAAAGVLTNAPGYDWQCANLLNYAHLSVAGTGTSTSADAPPVGSGLLGLPGDPMSVSRFVKCCVFRQGFGLLPGDGSGWLPTPEPVGATGSTQTIVNTALQMVQMITATPYATSLLAPAHPASSPTVGDWTLWQVARDHSNRVFYFSSAFNSAVQGVNLDQVDFSGGSVRLESLKSLPVLPGPASWCTDVSSKFS